MDQIRETPTRGLFGVAEDFTEKYQSLDARFIKNKTATFFFRAEGEAMTPTIFPGDILVVDRSLETFHGRICLIAYEGEFLCRRVWQKRGAVVLSADNHKMSPLTVRSSESILIWGVVIARAGDVC